MNSSSTTTVSRGTYNPRDISAHRRAYLDTYASRTRRKSEPALGEEDAAIPAAAKEVVATPVIKESRKPEVIAVPLEHPEDYMQMQPSSESFRYRPVMSEIVPRKSYLDTLQNRHKQAVKQAPLAEETILSSKLDATTESLFEEPVQNVTTQNDKKLEANLSALYKGSLSEQIAKNTTSASASHVRTIVFSALACGIMAVGIFTFASDYHSTPVVAQPIGSPVIEVESSNVSSQPAGTPLVANAAGFTVNAQQPVRLTISSIGVNTGVQSLGQTPEGLIEVPKAYGIAGWYNKSSVPGKSGPVVIVGHYSGGNGAVFDNLKDLKNGDLITTTNSKGQAVTYKVTAINEYDRDKVPMAEIFKDSKESRLEIITCAGKWQSNNYNKRLVVTAEIVK